MNQVNIDLSQISEEGILAGIINKRDNQIILLANKKNELEAEIEKLKKEIKELKNPDGKEEKPDA